MRRKLSTLPVALAGSFVLGALPAYGQSAEAVWDDSILVLLLATVVVAVVAALVVTSWARAVRHRPDRSTPGVAFGRLLLGTVAAIAAAEVGLLLWIAWAFRSSAGGLWQTAAWFHYYHVGLLIIFAATCFSSVWLLARRDRWPGRYWLSRKGGRA